MAAVKEKASLAHFNADAEAAALEEPSVTIDGLLYRGRLLSIDEWLPFWERLNALDAKAIAATADAAQELLRERVEFYRDYLSAVFPKKRYRFWAPDPVPSMCAQPFGTLERGVRFFFTLQEHATFGAMRAPGTDGISSSPSTTPRPAAASE